MGAALDIIGLEAGNGDLTLTRRQALGVRRKVWKDEIRYDRPADGRCAFDNLAKALLASCTCPQDVDKLTNNHRQPSIPCAPFRSPVIAPAMMPPKAPESTAAEM